MADLFVSYSRRDAGFVTKVAGQLGATGISTWMDTEGIDAGDRWKTAISQAVNQARWCMLVVSPRSMESRQVAAEVNMAFDKQRPIIPVVFEQAEINPDLDYALSGVQQIDFTGSFNDGMTALFRALGATASGQRLRAAVFDENENDARTVGGGPAFPMRVDRTGGIAMSDRGAAIDDALAMLLRTIPGERVGRPEFGCDIWDLVFERTDAATMRTMEDRVRTAIQRWEPRAEDASVRIVDHGRRYAGSLGPLHVTVAYTVRGTDERRETTELIELI